MSVWDVPAAGRGQGCWTSFSCCDCALCQEHGGGDGTWEPWQGFLIYKSTSFAWSASLIPAHPEGEATGKSPHGLGSARAAPGARGTSRQHLPLYLVFFSVKDPWVSPGLPGCMSTW